MKKRAVEEDEYKPSRSGTSLKKRKTDAPYKLVQHVTLKDLIDCKMLSPGQKIYVKEQEAEITAEGTIKQYAGNSQVVEEFFNPTSWTRHATGKESGGWQQIKLKPSNEILATVKERYISEWVKNGGTVSSFVYDCADEAAEDVQLPLNVRFACDASRPFKIIWVSPDYKEFHFEYQNEKYLSLAEFGQKIYDDMQNSNPPTNANFSFNSLVYEVEGKWLGAEKLLSGSVSGHSTPTQRAHTNVFKVEANKSKIVHADANNTPSPVRAANTNTSASATSSTGSATTTPAANTTTTTTTTPTHSPKKGSPQKDTLSEPKEFKILLCVENDDTPIRVNATASTLQEVLSTLAEESGLDVPDLNGYAVTVWDEEFALHTRFPKTIANLPTKCKVTIKKINKPHTLKGSTNGATVSGVGDVHMSDKSSDSKVPTQGAVVNMEIQQTTNNNTTTTTPTVIGVVSGLYGDADMAQ